MGKKNRVPEPEKSAFDRAKAAFDRVGEDYVPASKAVEPSKTEAPEVSVDDAATPETPVDAAATPVDVPDTDDAEAVSEPAETSDAESVEPADSDANGVESADSNAESVEPGDSGVKSVEPGDSDADGVEPETDADADSAETSEDADNDAAPEEPVSETVDDATPETSVDETPDTDTTAPEIGDDSGTPEPDAADDESDDFWTFGADEPESEEVTEMEKLTMETKEITLGVHRSPSAEVDTESREQEKKPKFYVKAFDRLKDALRARADSTEHVEHADDSTPPSGGSSRDAAIRKRVMQIEDEETRNYLLDRVLPQMAWYGKKVTQYRTMYFRLMAATILLGALIPVFSVGANSTAVKVIIAFLGASVTGINAYIALHNYRDLWLTYQTTRETLIHTLYCYFNQAGLFSYNNMSAEDLNVLLVNVCEDTLSREHGGWTTILQKTPTIS
ncbi:MAG: DUF4231 domain-containing protein [Oscillibacter sp.]|nr:DUF4231 domain-containing protein [Oscillibacter sp.]